jgi:hypothetical protein
MPLDVIGPGFGRTGTNSLKLALEHLGFGPCHHMFEVRDHAELLPDWERAAAGRPVDWERVFRGYRSQVDWPGAKFWRELAAAFPTARVVLTVRDPDAWFDSVQATIAPFIAARGKHASPHTNAIAVMAHRLLAQVFGEGGWTDRAHATRVFRDHIPEVQSAMPAARLLTFDLSDGWRPLCGFLGVPVPGIPFPQTNSSREFVDKEWKQPPAAAPA